MSLNTQDRASLDRMLGNELDFAFRRRVVTVFEYLDLAEGERVLDCGCGRGYYVRYARGLGCSTQLVGVDIDLHVLGVGRRGVGGDGAPRICACATRLPFPDGSFDKMILSETLEHIADHRAALREAWRVLRPGGLVALTVPNARFPLLHDPINRVLCLVQRPIRSGFLAGIWAGHVRLYEQPELIDLARSSGFDVEGSALLTHVCFPFQHNLLYGIGKPLLLSGRLPAALARAADRTDAGPGSRSHLNPVNLLRLLLGWVDRLNLHTRPTRRSVNVALRLRKGGEVRAACGPER